MATTLTTTVKTNTQSFSRTGTTGMLTPTNITKQSNNNFVLDMGLANKMRGSDITFKTSGLKPDEYHYVFFDNVPVSHCCSGPDYIWLDTSVNTTETTDFQYHKNYETVLVGSTNYATVLHRYGRMLFVTGVSAEGFQAGDILVGSTSNASAKISTYVKMNGDSVDATESTITLAEGSFDYGSTDSSNHSMFGNYANMFNSGAGAVITIVDGVGKGQQRIITSYNRTTRVATVDLPWYTTPTNSKYTLNTIYSTPDGTVMGVLHVPVNTFTTGQKKFRVSSSPTNSTTSDSYSETTFSSQGLLQDKAALSISTKGFNYSTQAASETFPTLTYVADVEQSTGVGPSPGPAPVIPTFPVAPTIDAVSFPAPIIAPTPTPEPGPIDQVWFDNNDITVNITTTANIVTHEGRKFIYPIETITGQNSTYNLNLMPNTQAPSSSGEDRYWEMTNAGCNHCGSISNLVTNFVVPSGGRIGTQKFVGTEAERTIKVIEITNMTDKPLIGWEENPITTKASSTKRYQAKLSSNSTASASSVNVEKGTLQIYSIYSADQSGTKTFTITGVPVTGEAGVSFTPNTKGLEYKNNLKVTINYEAVSPVETPITFDAVPPIFGQWFKFEVSYPQIGTKIPAGYGRVTWKDTVPSSKQYTYAYVPHKDEVVDDTKLNFRDFTNPTSATAKNYISNSNGKTFVKCTMTKSKKAVPTAWSTSSRWKSKKEYQQSASAATAMFNNLSNTIYILITDLPSQGVDLSCWDYFAYNFNAGAGGAEVVNKYTAACLLSINRENSASVKGIAENGNSAIYLTNEELLLNINVKLASVTGIANLGATAGFQSMNITQADIAKITYWDAWWNDGLATAFGGTTAIVPQKSYIDPNTKIVWNNFDFHGHCSAEMIQQNYNWTV